MNFDKSRVYTILNAEELKVGSKVIVADSLLELKEAVLRHRYPRTIMKVESEDLVYRFFCDDDCHYPLVYLLEELEEPLLKVGTEIKFKNGEVYVIESCINQYQEEFILRNKISEICFPIDFLIGKTWEVVK